MATLCLYALPALSWWVSTTRPVLVSYWAAVGCTWWRWIHWYIMSRRYSTGFRLREHESLSCRISNRSNQITVGSDIYLYTVCMYASADHNWPTTKPAWCYRQRNVHHGVSRLVLTVNLLSSVMRSVVDLPSLVLAGQRQSSFMVLPCEHRLY